MLELINYLGSQTLNRHHYRVIRGNPENRTHTSQKSQSMDRRQHIQKQDSFAPLPPHLTLEVNRLARIASGLLVGGDVGVELLLLGGDLGRVVLAGLGLLDLEVEDLELELEDLVLDLSDLEGVGVGAAGGGDGVVEAASVDLGALSHLPGVADDGGVGRVNVCQVVLVDLGRSIV